MKISKTQLQQIIKEELSVLSENEQPEIEQMLAAAIEAISEHQTSMPEPDDLLAYALEQLTGVQGLLRGGEESASDPEEETYVALVNYAADKMRHTLELGHDVATAEEEAKRTVLKLVNDALEEAAEIEL